MIALATGLVALWYVLRGAARWSPRAGWVVTHLSPPTRRLHEWVLSAPATFTYIAVFSASTVIARNAPSRLITMLTTRQGTSPVRLAADPTVLLTSALWVATAVRTSACTRRCSPPWWRGPNTVTGRRESS